MPWENVVRHDPVVARREGEEERSVLVDDAVAAGRGRVVLRRATRNESDLGAGVAVEGEEVDAAPRRYAVAAQAEALGALGVGHGRHTEPLVPSKPERSLGPAGSGRRARRWRSGPRPGRRCAERPVAVTAPSDVAHAASVRTTRFRGRSDLRMLMGSLSEVVESGRSTGTRRGSMPCAAFVPKRRRDRDDARSPARVFLRPEAGPGGHGSDDVVVRGVGVGAHLAIGAVLDRVRSEDACHRGEAEGRRLASAAWTNSAEATNTPGTPRSSRSLMSCTLHDVQLPQSASASITRSHCVEISWRRSTGAGLVNVGLR